MCMESAPVAKCAGFFLYLTLSMPAVPEPKRGRLFMWKPRNGQIKPSDDKMDSRMGNLSILEK